LHQGLRAKRRSSGRRDIYRSVLPDQPESEGILTCFAISCFPLPSRGARTNHSGTAGGLYFVLRSEASGPRSMGQKGGGRW
jgi:hypothetical protein